MADVRVEVSAAPFDRGGELLAEALTEIDAAHGRARLAIPGGSSLAAFRAAITKLGSAWARLCLTWVDERCVDVDDLDSNRGVAMRAGWLEPPPDRILPLWLDGETPETAVARVRSDLADAFEGALDVVLLGMGEDGHIASLFPGRDVLDVGVAYVPDSPKPPPERITLTPSVLRTARHTILVAAGAAKRPMLERVVAGDESLPVVGLPGLLVVTDLEGL